MWDIIYDEAKGIGRDYFAYRQAKENRSWQERMSNTAVQRRQDDLRKAGLNPYLAGMEGAVTPSGNVPNLQPHSAVAKSITDRRIQKQAGNLIGAQIEEVRSRADVNSAQADLIKQQNLDVTQSTANKVQELENLKRQHDKLKHDINSAESDSQRKKLQLQEQRVKSRLWKLANELMDMFKSKKNSNNETYFMEDLEKKMQNTIKIKPKKLWR